LPRGAAAVARPRCVLCGERPGTIEMSRQQRGEAEGEKSARTAGIPFPSCYGGMRGRWCAPAMPTEVVASAKFASVRPVMAASCVVAAGTGRRRRQEPATNSSSTGEGVRPGIRAAVPRYAASHGISSGYAHRVHQFVVCRSVACYMAGGVPSTHPVAGVGSMLSSRPLRRWFEVSRGR